MMFMYTALAVSRVGFTGENPSAKTVFIAVGRSVNNLFLIAMSFPSFCYSAPNIITARMCDE